MKGFTSKLLHINEQHPDVHGALRYPVYECAAFEFDSAEQLELSFRGSTSAHAYGRVSNPTVEAFEQRIAVMSEGYNCVAFSSGMAAITNAVLALCESGTNIIASKYLFGNTVSLFEKTLGPWGLEIRWIDPIDYNTIVSCIDEKTRLIFIETISNPQIVVADVAKIADIGNSNDIPLLLDNSLVTSYLLRSVDFGVALEVLSTAKYISGGGTAIGGVLIDNGIFDWSKSPRLVKESEKWGREAFIKTIRTYVARNIGACLSPHSAYLHMLGLETLSLRIEKSSSNAVLVAEYLNNHPKIERVHYPSLPNTFYHSLIKKQFRNGLCGGLLSFELIPEVPNSQFLNSLNLLKIASNFNDNKSLIIHPRSTLFCEYTPEKLVEMGINDQLIRLSVGIEEVEDIIADLDQALGNC